MRGHQVPVSKFCLVRSIRRQSDEHTAAQQQPVGHGNADMVRRMVHNVFHGILHDNGAPDNVDGPLAEDHNNVLVDERFHRPKLLAR